MKKLSSLLILIISIYGEVFSQENFEVNNDYSFWSRDTLGQSGKRREFIMNLPDFIDLLSTKDMRWILKNLNVPDFICNNGSLQFQYCIEYKLVDSHNYYKYSGTQNCKKNNNLGSFLSISFNDDRMVDFVVVVYRD